MHERLAPDEPFERCAGRIGVTIRHSPAAPLEFGNGRVEIVYLVGNVMHARPAVLLDELRHWTVGARGLQQLHFALAEVKGAITNPHVLDDLFGMKLRPEPPLEERRRGFEVLHRQGHPLHPFDKGHDSPPDR